MGSVPQWGLRGDPPFLTVQLPHPASIEVSPFSVPTSQAGRVGSAHYDTRAIIRFDIRVAISPSVYGIATDRDRIIFGKIGCFWLRWGGFSRKKLAHGECGGGGRRHTGIAVTRAFFLPFGKLEEYSALVCSLAGLSEPWGNGSAQIGGHDG